MKKMVFTDIFIRKLKPEGRKFIRSEGNGFTLRVMPSGVKTFLYIYTFNGRRREMALGPYESGYVNAGTNVGSLAEARQKFEEARRKVISGIDPLAEKELMAEENRLAPTVAKLCEEYIEKWAKPRKKSWENDERALNTDVIPTWGKIKAKDIRRRDIVLLLEGVVKRGSPVMANRLRALLHKMFTFAVDREIIESNPCAGVKPLAPEKPKERALSEEEIKILWENLDRPELIMSPEIKRSLKLILATGQRPGEVAGMHRREIKDRWWTIPPERSKNGKAHRVYLNNTALEIIGDGKGFIFPSPRGEVDRAIAAGALHCALRRNIKGQEYRRKGTKRTYKPKPEDPNRIGLADFTPHDLRRTVATRMAELGIMEEIIDRVLNHSRRGIIRAYNHYAYDKEIQAALESWERKLKNILSGKTLAKVFSIRTRHRKVKAL
jgi:integrase